jgi:hypothetical protein
VRSTGENCVRHTSTRRAKALGIGAAPPRARGSSRGASARGAGAFQPLRQGHAALPARGELDHPHAAKAAVVVGREHAEAAALPRREAERGEAGDLGEGKAEQQQGRHECTARGARELPGHPATIPKGHARFKRSPVAADSSGVA